MKIRRPLPLLLLLSSPCLVAADVSANKLPLQKRDDVLTQQQIYEMNRIPGAPPIRGASKPDTAAVDVSSAKATESSRPYVGTEDAPVDGLDGKPHAGPFVDTTPEQTQSAKAKGTATASSSAKSLPTSLDKFKEGSAKGDDSLKVEDIPEKNDGVMNDDSRPVPKKGTTGTEGGVSEKSKAKFAKGGQVEHTPQEPKEAPPLPHSEQEAIEGKDGKAPKKDIKDVEKNDGPKRVGGEFGEGGYGMEKPTDLPDKPHNIPHPDPKTATTQTKSREDGPPVGAGSGSSWLTDTMPYTEGSINPTKPSIANIANAVPHEENLEEWFHSFVVSFTMIIFTEIGDKTFLVAALMAMRHPRFVVYSAAVSALICMTVLSAVLGHIAPTLLPKRFTTFAAAVLFLFFGAKMLREGLAMPKEAGVGEEMKEVEAELEEKEHTLARRASRKDSNPYILEAGRKSSPSPTRGSSSSSGALSGFSNLVGLVLSPAWVQTFIMTFLGEWGDRSQIATIAMAAGQDYWWVTLGAVAGHMCCTGLAVLGGRALAGKVSMRVVTIGGAGAFLVFGLLYMLECITEA